MKNNKRKVWKTGMIAGMLTMLVLAFSACGSEPEESSTAEAKATTTTTVTTEATTTTTKTTTTTEKTTTETSESTTAETATTAGCHSGSQEGAGKRYCCSRTSGRQTQSYHSKAGISYSGKENHRSCPQGTLRNHPPRSCDTASLGRRFSGWGKNNFPVQMRSKIQFV